MRIREEMVEGRRSSLPLAGAPRKRGEDNERVVAMAPPASALHPLYRVQAMAPRYLHGGTKRQALSSVPPLVCHVHRPGPACVCGPDHIFLVSEARILASPYFPLQSCLATEFIITRIFV